MSTVAAAVEALRRGEIVAFPTESSFGLGVDARSKAALDRLCVLKGREPGKPPPVLVVGEAMVDALVATVPPHAAKLMRKFWPGPLTLALPARPELPEALVLDGAVGVRWSPHSVASELVRSFGAPVTATSANLAGERPAFTVQEVRDIFGMHVFVLAGDCGRAPASTVVRIDTDGAMALVRRVPIDFTELENEVAFTPRKKDG